MTADCGQICRVLGLKHGPKLVGMFNRFIWIDFNVFGTFEKFDLDATPLAGVMVLV